MRTVGIIIVHFGNKQNTLSCISSLKEINNSSFKVCIVDNGTNSLNKKELNKILPSALLIKNKINLGFSGGVNKGITRILKDPNIIYILILNNDVIVYPYIMSVLIQKARDKDAGIVGGVITYYTNSKVVWFAGGYLNKLFCYTRHLYLNKILPFQISNREVDFITGAAMLINKSVIEKIGLFDEEYFLYWEDVDYCTRAKEKGFKVYCVNNVIVQHRISSSAGMEGSIKLSALQAYYYGRNPFIFIKKHKFSVLTSLLGQFFIRFPFYIIKCKNLKAVQSYIRGVRDGIFYFKSHTNIFHL